MKSKFKITEYDKIGIINTAFIGDIVISFFLAQNIKNLHHDCKIYFVTNPKVQDLLPLVQAIDFPVVFDKRNRHKGVKGILQIANLLREEGVELILAPHRSLRTTLVSFLSKPKLSVSYSTSTLRFLYKKVVPYLYKVHEIYRNYQLLSIFEEYEKIEPLPNVELDFPNVLIARVQNLLGKTFAKKDLVTISPGSVWKTKRWHSDGFLFVAKELFKMNKQVVLVGGKEDIEICDEISRETGAINLAGKTNLAESLYVIKMSKLLITNDSSPTHLASLVKCPTVTIFGPTIPEFGFYPLSPKSQIIQNENLDCKPCSIHGYNQCPLKHHKCMNEITPERVLNTAIEVLS
ncbi:glycosyltransferase family 9 protein [Bacteroidetes/Chlorobi group bacterium Naka2016]|jgi:heptosyltransferase-2|nr:MAG: glycosyltransferase family 9 protein [Bacteroidetes/Chlorobi group bacterium Naka2016]